MLAGMVAGKNFWQSLQISYWTISVLCKISHSYSAILCKISHFSTIFYIFAWVKRSDYDRQKGSGTYPDRPAGRAWSNLGYRLETIVAIHLIRKCKIEGLDVYYLNDRSGECDFVVSKGNKVVQAIQVSYDISSDKTRKREINGLSFPKKKLTRFCESTFF